MEEWQRRLKAEKEEERKKKTESAEILRGYRGGVKDEDLKLKALREEERKRHQDAQQNLHSYKSSQLQESSKPKEQNRRQSEQHYPTPVNAANGSAGRDPMEGIVSGSVSEKAAALTAFAESVTEPTVLSQTHREREQLTSLDTSDAGIGAGEFTTPPTEATETTDSLAAEQSNTDAAQPENAESFTTKETLIVTSLMTEVPTAPVEQRTVGGAAAIDEPTVITMIPMVDDPTVATKTEIDTGIADTAGTKGMVAGLEPPQPVRVEVLFSFGLVTAQSLPELTSYMTAVQKVVVKCLQSRIDSITYDPLHMPYVKEIQWDGTSRPSQFRIYLRAV